MQQQQWLPGPAGHRAQMLHMLHAGAGMVSAPRQ